MSMHKQIIEQEKPVQETIAEVSKEFTVHEESKESESSAPEVTDQKVLQQNETFAVEGEREKKKTSESSATYIVQSTDKDFSVSLPSTATPLKDSLGSKNICLTKLNLQLISPDELTRTRSSKFKLN